jgi:hypothetical protein
MLWKTINRAKLPMETGREGIVPGPHGASLTLRLALSNKTTPVKIDAAIVRWTIKDQYFGVKFLNVEPTERLALDQFIASLGLGAPLTLF